MTAPTLTTKLDREAPEAKARFAHNHALAQQLRAAVAEAALGLALRRAGGRFTHDNEAMRRAAREWRRVRETGEEALSTGMRGSPWSTCSR